MDRGIRGGDENSFKRCVTVDGSGSMWTVDGYGPNIRLVVGGTGIISSGLVGTNGGTGLLSITNGGHIEMDSHFAPPIPAWVGISGTLTGDDSFRIGPGFDLPNFGRELIASGTLAPNNLKIYANLGFDESANTVCNLTSADIDDRIDVDGKATLNGRLTVTMTGGFTPGTRFTLLHAKDGIGAGFFSSVSINYLVCPTCVPAFTPVIQYDYEAGNVYLYLDPE